MSRLFDISTRLFKKYWKVVIPILLFHCICVGARVIVRFGGNGDLGGSIWCSAVEKMDWDCIPDKKLLY